MGEGFDDGKALRVRAEIDDSQINILQSEAENIEGVFRGVSFRRSVSALLT